jgi:hypothetical protein
MYNGATDTAKAGMGGVWFINDEAILWRSPFSTEVQQKLVSTKKMKGTVTNSDLELAATIAQHPIVEEAGYPTAGESMHTFCDNTPAVTLQTKGSTSPFSTEVQQKVVSTKNPKGTVTNSDLELAATIAQHHILEKAGYLTAGESMHTFCDNTQAVTWQTKGSTSMTQVAANLLRHGALHQQKTGHNQQYEYLVGEQNVMADNASRLWQHDNTNHLLCLNRKYPQIKPWLMRHLSPPVLLKLTSLLCWQKWPQESPSSEKRPKKPTGNS